LLLAFVACFTLQTETRCQNIRSQLLSLRQSGTFLPSLFLVLSLYERQNQEQHEIEDTLLTQANQRLKVATKIVM